MGDFASKTTLCPESMNKTIKILRIALEGNPESWETRRHLAELLLEEGQSREARDCLLAAPAVPANEDDELFIAKHLLEAQPAKAGPYIDRALRRNKGSAEAHWLNAQLFLALGLADDARRHYTTATVLEDAYENPGFEATLESMSGAAVRSEESDQRADFLESAEAELMEPAPESGTEEGSLSTPEPASPVASTETTLPEDPAEGDLAGASAAEETRTPHTRGLPRPPAARLATPPVDASVSANPAVSVSAGLAGRPKVSGERGEDAWRSHHRRRRPPWPHRRDGRQT